MSIVVVALLASCTADEPTLDLGTAVDSDTPQITLYITFSGGTTRATDATWGDTYTSAEATAFETTISSLQVLFFNTDGSLAGASEQKSLWSYTNSSDDNTDEVGYEYIGSIDVSNASFTSGSTTTNADGTSTTTFTGTIMLLANCPDATTTDYTTDSDGTVTYGSSSSSTDDSSDDSTDDDTTTNPPILIRSLANATDANGNTLSTDIERIAYLTYNYTDVTTSTGLPMWGILSTGSSSITFTSGYNTSLGTIYLLRAMSKVTVALDTDAATIGYSIASVTLKGGYNTSGLCLPAGYVSNEGTNSMTVVGATTEISTTDCVNIATSTTSSTSDLSFTSDDSAYLLYLPEMETTSSSSTSTSDGATTTTYTTTPYITVSLTDPDSESLTKTLYLCEYDDNSQPTASNFTLTRNHVYSYTLTTSMLQVTSAASNWIEDEPSSVGWEVDDSNITFVALNGSTTDASKGDVEGRYCLVLYPEWNDDFSSHSNGERANASFGFTLSPDAKFTTGTITWEAHLTNTEYFEFSYSKLTDSEAEKVFGDDAYTAYNVSTGVNRDDSYGIKVVCKEDMGQWYKTYTTTTDEDGNETTTLKKEGIRTSAVNSEYAIVDTSADSDTIIAVYTDLFILATGAGMTYPLKINPAEDRDNAIFTPNRFAGGTKDISYIDSNKKHHIIGEHKWIRIYWAWPDTDRDTVLKKIMAASDDDEVWYPAN